MQTASPTRPPTAHSAGSRGPGTAELRSNWAWTCHTGQACDHGSQLLPWALAPWLSPRGHPECPHSIAFLPPSLSLLTPQPPVCAQMSPASLPYSQLCSVPCHLQTRKRGPWTRDAPCCYVTSGCGDQPGREALCGLPLLGISLVPGQRGLGRGQEVGFGFSPGLCWLCSLGW